MMLATSLPASAATASVLATEYTIELTDDDHARIELIPEFDDPLAQQGEEYSFRIVLPSGDEENYDAVNGVSQERDVCSLHWKAAVNPE
jgi:hypothetical protein